MYSYILTQKNNPGRPRQPTKPYTKKQTSPPKGESIPVADSRFNVPINRPYSSQMNGKIQYNAIGLKNNEKNNGRLEKKTASNLSAYVRRGEAKTIDGRKPK